MNIRKSHHAPGGAPYGIQFKIPALAFQIDLAGIHANADVVFTCRDGCIATMGISVEIYLLHKLMVSILGNPIRESHCFHPPARLHLVAATPLNLKTERLCNNSLIFKEVSHITYFITLLS